jgi:hypothetical protein
VGGVLGGVEGVLGVDQHYYYRSYRRRCKNWRRHRHHLSTGVSLNIQHSKNKSAEANPGRFYFVHTRGASDHGITIPDPHPRRAPITLRV